ncbi:IS66 family transposase [Bradyrhizobium sp. USDA 4011]
MPSGGVHSIGYAAFNALARDHGGAIQLAFCLVHARRKFVEVFKTTQSRARGERTPADSLCRRREIRASSAVQR